MLDLQIRSMGLVVPSARGPDRSSRWWNDQDVVIQNLTAPAETPWLLRLDGAQTRNIRFPLVNPKDLRRIEFGPGIDRSQLATR